MPVARSMGRLGPIYAAYAQKFRRLAQQPSTIFQQKLATVSLKFRIDRIPQSVLSKPPKAFWPAGYHAPAEGIFAGEETRMKAKFAYHANCWGPLGGNAVGVTSISELTYRTFGDMGRAIARNRRGRLRGRGTVRRQPARLR